MTYKQIEASREARLWITQVIVPTIAVATTVIMAVPEFRKAAEMKLDDIRAKIRRKTFK